MPIDPDNDAIRPVMDSVQPFVAKGNFAGASEVVERAIVEALNERRREDAAALSSILSSFLTIIGEDEPALRALERAEALDSTNLHHALATARHMLTRLGDVDAAEGKALVVLANAGSDHQLAHVAFSVLGQCSFAKGAFGKALFYLRRAQDAAIEGDLHPRAWDFFLVQEVARVDPANETWRTYARELLRRAQAHSHAISEKRAKALLSNLGEG
jgi:hypothetical protein